jgi:hypothetical protein
MGSSTIMSTELVYRDYWRRKQLLDQSPPAFPLRRWWPTDGLSDSELVCFDAVRDAASLLDFGAGDLRVRRKFLAAGFKGRYDTLDIGHEHSYTFAELGDVRDSYDAILCLDVIEHLPLAEGLELLEGLAGRLRPGGKLIVQTPNARCIRHPLSTDMTHCQVYNAGDLWSVLTCLDLEVHGYRVAFGRPGFWSRLLDVPRRYLITRVLGCDDADNLLLIARKPGQEDRP